MQPTTILEHIQVATSDKQIRQLLNVGEHINRGVEGSGQIRRDWLKAARQRRLELQIVEVKPNVIKIRAKQKEQRRRHLRDLLRKLRGQGTQ